MAKMGHPTKYRASFHIYDFIRLSKLGKNITQIALEWDVHRDTIYEWGNKHKDFSDALKKGKSFAEAWYMNLGQLAMIGQAQINGQKVKVDVGLFVWMTKNMFKWSDKVDVKASEQNDKHRPLEHLTDEELDEL